MLRTARTWACSHSTLYADVSPYAAKVNFERQALEKRQAATTPSGRITKSTSREDDRFHMSFPGPLVLPGDDLATDPKWPPQSLRSWLMLKERNSVTESRRRIYVVSYPDITPESASMRAWTQPKLPERRQLSTLPFHINAVPPSGEQICEYLRAFYHGLDVKLHAEAFRWVPWEEESVTDQSRFVGLAADDGQCVRIRCRPSPDQLASSQLNLNDILDALMEVVPDDAYAVIMLISHDLYEDEEDDFCCGRAYGASRIAVVSSFRYQPCLDAHSGVDHGHMWPASHCSSYIEQVCGLQGKDSRGTSYQTAARSEISDPLPSAVVAAEAALIPKSYEDFNNLWLSRVSRTTSHELGHCFGFDHCVYYACVMQGTCGLAEDGRQPPYLCPVCLAKLTAAVVGIKADKSEERDYIRDRYRALKNYCERWSSVGMFAGFHAWLDARLGQ